MPGRPNTPPPVRPEEEPLPPLPRMWPPDGVLVGHWAEQDSRALRLHPVHLLEDREKLLVERQALLDERERARRLREKRAKRRARRKRGRCPSPPAGEGGAAGDG